VKRLLLLTLAVALAACSRTPGNNAAPPGAASSASAQPAAASAAPSAKLAQIFTPDILGANLAFLETLTGPAFQTDGDENTYKVDGCEVIVGQTKGRIDNIGVIGVSPHCSFNIAQYFAEGYDHPVQSLPTFGDIETGLGGDYAADCYMSCGNAAEPVVSLSYEGSHADNFNELLAQVSIGDGPELEAYGDWGARLVAKYGQDAVAQARVADALPDIAAKDFAPVRPTTIRVGRNLIAPHG